MLRPTPGRPGGADRRRSGPVRAGRSLPEPGVPGMARRSSPHRFPRPGGARAALPTRGTGVGGGAAELRPGRTGRTRRTGRTSQPGPLSAGAPFRSEPAATPGGLTGARPPAVARPPQSLRAPPGLLARRLAGRCRPVGNSPNLRRAAHRFRPRSPPRFGSAKPRRTSGGGGPGRSSGLPGAGPRLIPWRPRSGRLTTEPDPNPGHRWPEPAARSADPMTRRDSGGTPEETSGASKAAPEPPVPKPPAPKPAAPKSPAPKPAAAKPAGPKPAGPKVAAAPKPATAQP